MNSRRVFKFNSARKSRCAKTSFAYSNSAVFCRYFIYGLQDAQHLERVRLEFQMFDIQKGEHKDKDKE